MIAPATGGPRPAVVLAFVAALALAARTLVALSLGPLPEPDTPAYQRMARELAESGSYREPDEVTGTVRPTAFRMPLYPFVMSGVYRLTGPGAAADRILVGLQIGLSTAIALLAAAAGIALSGGRLGLAAGVGCALDPLFLLHGTKLLTDTLFAFLVALSLAAGCAALRTRRWGWLFAWGAAAGLATLARPLTKFYLVVPLLVLAAAGEGRRALLRRALPVALGTAVVLGPWVVRNGVQLGFWGLELNQGMNTLWSTLPLTRRSTTADYAADPRLARARDIVAGLDQPIETLAAVRTGLGVTTPEADGYLGRIGMENIRRRPLAFLGIVGKNAVNVLTSPATAQDLGQRWFPADPPLTDVGLAESLRRGLRRHALVNLGARLASLAFFAAAVLGWLRLWQGPSRRPWLLLFALTVAYVVGLTSAVAGYDRYRLPVEAVLWLCAAALCVPPSAALPGRVRPST